ncbi:MAG: Ldh family oxidoreductase [Planctomycetales bacterium]
MPTIPADRLARFVEALFVAGGVSTAHAHIVAESLVASNLRGYDSHGVMRVPSYLSWVKDGRVHPEARLQVVQESPSSLVGDGGWGLGQVVTQELMRRLIEKSATAGIVCGTLRQAAHIGRLGEYAETAAAAGRISMICANTHGAGQRVSPVGGKRPRLGTNPLCIGVPGGVEGPFILDFGTSATAEGKVRVKKIAGEKVPAGWLLDSEGKPTLDPNTLYGDPPGTILPMGGDQAYKGFGLAFMIEMLCGGLSGGPCSYPNPPAPFGNCAFFVVINPDMFAGTEHLLKEVSGLEQYVRSVPLIDGVQQVTLPGDPERRVVKQKQAQGIFLDAGNWQPLQKLAEELRVPLPELQGEG